MTVSVELDLGTSLRMGSHLGFVIGLGLKSGSGWVLGLVLGLTRNVGERDGVDVGFRVV